MLIPNYGRIVNKAESLVCASKMRSLHTALNSYLQDHEMVWPQGPIPQKPGWGRFWLATLAPYGITQSNWQCRGIRRHLRGQQDTSGVQLALHYVPTTFSDTPNIAHRWASQPWLIEASNAHGQGCLICMADGSVKSMYQILYEQGHR